MTGLLNFFALFPFNPVSDISIHCTLRYSSVKLSRNRLRKAIGLRDVKDPRLSTQSAHGWR
jgi:hypothetical protein